MILKSLLSLSFSSRPVVGFQMKPMPFTHSNQRFFRRKTNINDINNSRKDASSCVFLSSSAKPISSSPAQEPLRINLETVPLDDLSAILKSWKQPAYRAKQIHHWIRERGVTNPSEMSNLPKTLIQLLEEHTTGYDRNSGDASSLDDGSSYSNQLLECVFEQQSIDGTVKRAYQLHDGQIVESVLMPYENKSGRNTACISSQAGCAMGCVFCATGQMGFARQLTSEEIFAQVSRFDIELKKRGERLSNVVMMGMGEPLANYRNVMEAIKRMNEELGIGARKITVSTVGVVPNIRKLIEEKLPIKLAISLHCATEEERSKLLPANKRYGGLDELMLSVKEYTEKTKRRITLEWALIEFQNDSPQTARQLGNLLKRFDIRMDLIHINVIPLNPTGGFENGRPSGKNRVEQFIQVLEKEFRVSATPRMRRGIDIDAGCGQLKSKIKKKKKQIRVVEQLPSMVQQQMESEEDYIQMEDDLEINLSDKQRKEIKDDRKTFKSFNDFLDLESSVNPMMPSLFDTFKKTSDLDTNMKDQTNSVISNPIVGVYEDDDEDDTPDDEHNMHEVTPNQSIYDVDFTTSNENENTNHNDGDNGDDDFYFQSDTSLHEGVHNSITNAITGNPMMSVASSEKKRRDPLSERDSSSNGDIESSDPFNELERPKQTSDLDTNMKDQTNSVISNPMVGVYDDDEHSMHEVTPNQSIYDVDFTTSNENENTNHNDGDNGDDDFYFQSDTSLHEGVHNSITNAITGNPMMSVASSEKRRRDPLSERDSSSNGDIESSDPFNELERPKQTSDLDTNMKDQTNSVISNPIVGVYEDDEHSMHEVTPNQSIYDVDFTTSNENENTNHNDGDNNDDDLDFQSDTSLHEGVHNSITNAIAGNPMMSVASSEKRRRDPLNERDSSSNGDIESSDPFNELERPTQDDHSDRFFEPFQRSSKPQSPFEPQPTDQFFEYDDDHHDTFDLDQDDHSDNNRKVKMNGKKNMNVEFPDNSEEDLSFDLDFEDDSLLEMKSQATINPSANSQGSEVEQFRSSQTVDLDWDEDFEDEEYQTDKEIEEANRLLSLVQSSFPAPPSSKAQSPASSEHETESLLKGPTTTITDEESIREAKKRRKKLIRNLKQIDKLLEQQHKGIDLNEEQRIKVSRKDEWRAELESVEHNLQ